MNVFDSSRASSRGGRSHSEDVSSSDLRSRTDVDGLREVDGRLDLADTEFVFYSVEEEAESAWFTTALFERTLMYIDTSSISQCYGVISIW